MRTGLGFDVHRFSDDPARKMILGGVVVPGPGLVGHSDADVISHAITDAILGAGDLGDMGVHFPDTDPAWAGADSLAMLRAAIELVSQAGWKLTGVDCTVIAEAPKLAPFRQQIKQNLTEVVGVAVSVKATRAEGLGSLGRVEGMACMAVANIEKADTSE